MKNSYSRTATKLLTLCGAVGRTLPEVRGRGRVAIALSSLFMRAGADPIVTGTMAGGHLLRLDCRVPLHCWAFFSGGYDDRKIAVLRSLMRPGGIALDVGANIGFYTVPLAIHAKAIGGKIVAFEPLKSNAEWLNDNLLVNNCGDAVQVIESALGNESGSAEIVLVDDFLGGGTVGNATIMNEALYEQRFAKFARAKIKIETLDRLWSLEDRIDVIKVDIEGNETQFLEGGKSTIASHRPALLIEVNLGQQALRNINFSEAISSLLPERYVFFELRGRSMIEIRNLTDSTDADVLAMPQERRHEIV